MTGSALLTVEQMYTADRLTIEGGTPGAVLMENAGVAIAGEIMRRWEKQPVAILCGPGNNGGDGFVIARLLKDRGWPVRLALPGDMGQLTGDALHHARLWTGQTESLSADILGDGPLVVDALFGAGLSRPLDGMALEMITAINQRALVCVGVDVPSGVDGDTGEILGGAPRCQLTVTFFRAKPGHLLMPGRELAGELVVADIGIGEQVLNTIQPKTFANDPDLWLAGFPWPKTDGHKFDRGHLIITGGLEMTGAALLAALAARRIGAGLVTIAAPEGVGAIYRNGLPGNIVSTVNNSAEFETLLADTRKNTVLVGPGLGVSEATRRLVMSALETDKRVVLDADALTAFADDPQALLGRLNANHILTPHEGEFARLFDTGGDKPTRARKAALLSGATVLLKGPDTVIAAPDGRAVINTSGTPYLATAGSGDVLAGLIAGLTAQGMTPFDAAAAGAWVHGRAGELSGPGLIAEDLPDVIPDVLSELS